MLPSLTLDLLLKLLVVEGYVTFPYTCAKGLDRSIIIGLFRSW